MDENDFERMLPGWQATSEAVARELVAWREAHPKASLTQIEDAVCEAVQRLQARALQQVVHASATADVAAQPAAERPTCPTCWSSIGATRPPAAHDPTSPTTNAPRNKPQLRRLRRVWSRCPTAKPWSFRRRARRHGAARSTRP